MEPIRGQTPLQAEDFKSAWLALPEVRRFAFGAAFLLLMWTVAAGMYPAAAYMVVPIGGLGFGYAMLRGRARWTAAGLENLGSGTVEYLFDDYGYHLTAPGRESRLEWRALHRHIESKEAFLIYTAPQVATLVPKRAFAADDQARLRAELQARIPPPKPRGRGAAKAALVWVVLVVAFLAVWQLVIAPSPR